MGVFGWVFLMGGLFGLAATRLGWYDVGGPMRRMDWFDIYGFLERSWIGGERGAPTMQSLPPS